MKYFSLVSLASISGLFLSVQTVSAQGAGLVTCRDGGACNFCDFIKTVNTVNQWVLIVATLIGVIIIIYAGYRITAARGQVDVVTEGRKLIGNAAIGIFIIVLAVSIVDIVLKTTTGDGYGVWNKPTCGSGQIQTHTPNSNRGQTGPQ